MNTIGDQLTKEKVLFIDQSGSVKLGYAPYSLISHRFVKRSLDYILPINNFEIFKKTVDRMPIEPFKPGRTGAHIVIHKTSNVGFTFCPCNLIVRDEPDNFKEGV